MQEARLILPVEGGKNPSRAHGALAAALVKRFGGFTKTHGHGAWKDPAGPKVFYEPVTIYDIAMDATVANEAALINLALTWGRATAQLAVYVRGPSGRVSILDVDAAHAVAA